MPACQCSELPLVLLSVCVQLEILIESVLGYMRWWYSDNPCENASAPSRSSISALILLFCFGTIAEQHPIIDWNFWIQGQHFSTGHRAGLVVHASAS